MGFWGVEVKPGETQSFQPQAELGKLHVTQATLGSGSGKEKSVVQVSVGDSNPIYLCSLLPNKNESCPLNLEFDDDDESVEFSVTGNTSIHLSGYIEPYEHEDEQDADDEDDDSDGINMGECDSSDYDSEEEEQMDELEEFLDSNLNRLRNASAPKSRVVIEEIEEEEKPAKEDKPKQPKNKIQASEEENLLESEDEDGFPISKEKASELETKTAEKMDLDNEEKGSNKKRKAKASEQESENKNKKKKNQREKKKGENASNEEAKEQVVQKKQEPSQTPSTPKPENATVNNAMNESAKAPDTSAEKKNKKKNKNKKKASEEATVESKTTPSSVEKPKPASASKSSHERTYPNGLVVEELAMGKPNAKKANPGSQVSVRYIGKLQKNGKIFDSNIAKAPFKFRLGVGQVIKGWDVGVQGMRVGDKRKLTIPPSMGYGAQGAGGQIPPNAWLVFDVELISVK